MGSSAPTVTVAVDANVLINLIHIRRLDLLARLPGHAFVVPEDVVAELSREAERRELQAAVAAGTARVERIVDLRDLARYADLRLSLRREALSQLGPGRLITTPGLLVLAIRNGLLTVDEADQAKENLERHRFRMSFPSFRDVVGTP